MNAFSTLLGRGRLLLCAGFFATTLLGYFVSRQILYVNLGQAKSGGRNGVRQA